MYVNIYAETICMCIDNDLWIWNGIYMFVHGCTMYIRVWTWSVHSMYMLQLCPAFLWRCECKPLLCSKHFPDIRCMYSPQHATYHASVQESAIWYRHCWAAYITAKNACGRWSAFLCHFLKNTSVSVWTWLNHTWTMMNDVCTRKSKNGTGKLTTCHRHS
jgi:hypothetical protein